MYKYNQRRKHKRKIPFLICPECYEKYEKGIISIPNSYKVKKGKCEFGCNKGDNCQD